MLQCKYLSELDGEESGLFEQDCREDFELRGAIREMIMRFMRDDEEGGTENASKGVVGKTDDNMSQRKQTYLDKIYAKTMSLRNGKEVNAKTQDDNTQIGNQTVEKTTMLEEKTDENFSKNENDKKTAALLLLDFIKEFITAGKRGKENQKPFNAAKHLNLVVGDAEKSPFGDFLDEKLKEKVLEEFVKHWKAARQENSNERAKEQTGEIGQNRVSNERNRTDKGHNPDTNNLLADKKDTENWIENLGQAMQNIQQETETCLDEDFQKTMSAIDDFTADQALNELNKLKCLNDDDAGVLPLDEIEIEINQKSQTGECGNPQGVDALLNDSGGGLVRQDAVHMNRGHEPNHPLDSNPDNDPWNIGAFHNQARTGGGLLNEEGDKENKTPITPMSMTSTQRVTGIDNNTQQSNKKPKTPMRPMDPTSIQNNSRNSQKQSVNSQKSNRVNNSSTKVNNSQKSNRVNNSNISDITTLTSASNNSRNSNNNSQTTSTSSALTKKNQIKVPISILTDNDRKKWLDMMAIQRLQTELAPNLNNSNNSGSHNGNSNNGYGASGAPDLAGLTWRRNSCFLASTVQTLVMSLGEELCKVLTVRWERREYRVEGVENVERERVAIPDVWTIVI